MHGCTPTEIGLGHGIGPRFLDRSSVSMRISLVLLEWIVCPPEVGLLMRNQQQPASEAKPSICRFSGGRRGGGYYDVRARGESLLGAGATDRRVLADLVAAPGGLEPRRTRTRRCLTWGWGSGPASACRFSAGSGLPHSTSTTTATTTPPPPHRHHLHNHHTTFAVNVTPDDGRCFSIWVCRRKLTCQQIQKEP